MVNLVSIVLEVPERAEVQSRMSFLAASFVRNSC